MASPKGKSKVKTSASRRPIRPGRNAPRTEKVQVSLLKAILSRTFLIVAAAIISSVGLIILFTSWFNKVYADPEKVFWGMIDNNLATAGVTKTLTRDDAGGSQTEHTQLSINPEPIARSIKVLAVKDEAQQTTNLTLEAILTPKSEFQHYTKIQRPGAGSSENYRSVYDMWLKAPSGDSGRSTGFDNAFFGAMFFGNFNRKDRQMIIDKLRKAYTVDFSRADKKIVDGRRTYTYQLSVNMRKYTESVIEYAKLLGTPAGAAVNPNSFSADDKVVVDITVDTLTRQVKSVRYDRQVTELYSGYGIPAELKPPAKTVSSDELQKAIQEAGQ